jgi:hypothetical protein
VGRFSLCLLKNAAALRLAGQYSYHMARERSPEQRAALLAQADPGVRGHVESLLSQRGGDMLLDRPAIEAAPALPEDSTVTILTPRRLSGAISYRGQGRRRRRTIPGCTLHTRVQYPRNVPGSRDEKRPIRRFAPVDAPHMSFIPANVVGEGLAATYGKQYSFFV